MNWLVYYDYLSLLWLFDIWQCILIIMYYILVYYDYLSLLWLFDISHCILIIMYYILVYYDYLLWLKMCKLRFIPTSVDRCWHLTAFNFNRTKSLLLTCINCKCLLHKTRLIRLDLQAARPAVVDVAVPNERRTSPTPWTFQPLRTLSHN